MSSQTKTLVLMSLLSALLIFMGGAIAGRAGLYLALVIAIVMNVGSYWFSDKIVLSVYRAKELAPHDAPMLHKIIEELAQNAGIPKPKVYMVPQESPNAFATGRSPEHAAVAVTQGILKLLSADELRGVLAHEMSHIKNRDTLIQTIAAVMASCITFLGYMLQWTSLFGGGRDERSSPIAGILMAILAPIAATLIQLGISRSREYLADKTGASICKDPHSLASALGKLSTYSQSVPMQAPETTAHMFIVNPLTGKSLAGLFSTHPPIEDRIARLEEMQKSGRF